MSKSKRIEKDFDVVFDAIYYERLGFKVDVDNTIGEKSGFVEVLSPNKSDYTVFEENEDYSDKSVKYHYKYDFKSKKCDKYANKIRKLISSSFSFPGVVRLVKGKDMGCVHMCNDGCGYAYDENRTWQMKNSFTLAQYSIFRDKLKIGDFEFSLLDNGSKSVDGFSRDFKLVLHIKTKCVENFIENTKLSNGIIKFIGKLDKNMGIKIRDENERENYKKLLESVKFDDVISHLSMLASVGELENYDESRYTKKLSVKEREVMKKQYEKRLRNYERER